MSVLQPLLLSLVHFTSPTNPTSAAINLHSPHFLPYSSLLEWISKSHCCSFCCLLAYWHHHNPLLLLLLLMKQVRRAKILGAIFTRENGSLMNLILSINHLIAHSSTQSLIAVSMEDQIISTSSTDGNPVPVIYQGLFLLSAQTNISNQKKNSLVYFFLFFFFLLLVLKVQWFGILGEMEREEDNVCGRLHQSQSMAIS